MVGGRQNNKDIPQIFSVFRAQLQAKEKQLLDLQRAEPCLLPPDENQVESLLEAIAALQLSTQDGAFIFASTTVDTDDFDDTSSRSSICSMELNSIKALPSNIWLAESNYVKQEKSKPSYIFQHLLSLPIGAFLPSATTPVKAPAPAVENVPIINRWPFMSLDAFKPASNTCTSIESNKQNDAVSTSSKSMLNGDSAFSKQFWLQKRQETTTKPTVEPEVAFSKQFWLQNKQQTPTESVIDIKTTFSKEMWVQKSQQTVVTRTKSLVENDATFSKQYWLQNSTPTNQHSTKSLVNNGGRFAKELWLSNN